MPEPDDDLSWGLAAIEARRPYYELHRRYYEGEHRLAFATEQFRSTFGSLFEKLTDNICPGPVDSLVDRLQLLRWSAGTDTALGQMVADLWDRNRMQRRSGELHLSAAQAGDGFVIVGQPRPGGPVRIWPQEPESCAVQYDDEDDPDRVVRAIKLWLTAGGYWRANVYTPELTRRWVTREKANGTGQSGTADRPKAAAAFRLYTDDADVGPEVPQPLGASPMVHFPNDAPPGKHGRSELHNVVPMQDALNKSVADMLVAGEFVALPQRALIGVEKEYDPTTGEERKVSIGADRIVVVRNKDAKLEQFDAADLSGFLAVQEAWRVEAARVTGTPPHDMGMASTAGLSGEALSILEGRIVKKAIDRQLSHGDGWAQVMARGVVLETGTEARLEELAADLKAAWAPPNTRPELYALQVAQAKVDLGYSLEQALREHGMDDDDIEAMLEERTASIADLGEAALTAFDRGGSAPIAPAGSAGMA